MLDALIGEKSILPGNLQKKWENLLPGTSVRRLPDNIRLSAKLFSEISKRLDAPREEDIYALYNSMAHDRTYQNSALKSTPYFVKRAMEEQAWNYDDWALDIDGVDIRKRNLTGPEPSDYPVQQPNRGFSGGRKLPSNHPPPDRPIYAPAFSRRAAERRKREIEKVMKIDRTGYFKNEPMQAEYRRLLEQLHGTST